MASFSLPKNPEQQKRLLLGLLPLLLVFVYYQFVHGKKVAEIETLDARYQQLDAQNAAMRPQALTGGAELQQKLALFEQHMKRLEELIPQSEEVPQLLNSMSERAQDAQVDLSLMRPQAENPGQFYTEQSYEIAVIGGYHEIGRYLGMIASLSRIITPVELKLEPRVGETMRDGTPRLQAGFRIITYVVPPVEMPTTPVGNAGVPPQGGASGQH
jgi:type IV pilus assembly protein PilO